MNNNSNNNNPDNNNRSSYEPNVIDVPILKRYFDIILASTCVGGIGCKGDLPWQKLLKNELKYFKMITSRGGYNAIIMGRKTWESISCKPLTGRLNIVISKTIQDSDIQDKNIIRQVNLNNHSDLTFESIFGSETTVKLTKTLFMGSLDNALTLLAKDAFKGVENIFVIGGAQLYNEALVHPKCSTIYYTEIIDPEFICDTFLSVPIIYNGKSCKEKFIITEQSNIAVENHIMYRFYKLASKFKLNVGDVVELKSGKNVIIKNAETEYGFLTIDHDLFMNTDVCKIVSRATAIGGDRQPQPLETKTDLQKLVIATDYTVCKGEMQYLAHLKSLLEVGDHRNTRNGYTYSLFGNFMSFDLSLGFPLLTTKKMFLRGIFEELKFFLLGKTNTKELEEKKVNIWTDNTSRAFLDKVGLQDYQEGDLGNLYGYQFLHYGHDYTGMDKDYNGKGYNQLEKAIFLIKNDPHSRRILMTTFDPSRAHQAPLYPCHSIVLQWYVESNNRLSVVMYQRSADWFLGKPFNVASVSLQCHLFVIVINSDPEYKGPQLVPGRVLFFDGDTHLYDQPDHIEGAKLQLSRKPYPFPTIEIKKKTTKFEDFNFEDILLHNYNSYGTIKAKMVV